MFKVTMEGDTLPVSSERYETAKATLSSLPSPGVQATQKQQLDYLRKMVTALTISFEAYQYNLEKKLKNIDNCCKSKCSEMDTGIGKVDETYESARSEIDNVRRELSGEIDTVRSQLNVDIVQMVKRCADIEKRLDKFENKFHYNPEVTIVAKNLPDLHDTGDKH